MKGLKIINRWQCWVKSLYRSLWTLPILTSGHLFVEKYDNREVSILECEVCNYPSVCYYKQWVEKNR